MIYLENKLADVKYQDKSNPPLILGQNMDGLVREVHPMYTYKTRNYSNFTDGASIKFIPYCRVFGGTRGLKSEVIGGVLRSQLDAPNSSCFRLTQHKFNGSILTMDARIGNVAPVDVIPSSFVLASTKDFTRRVEVAFGSNGTSIVGVEAGAVVFQKTLPHTIASNDRIRVIHIKSLVEVYVNGLFIHSAQHSSLDRGITGGSYCGVSTTQNGTTQSSGFTDLNIDGSTNLASEPIARVDADHFVIPYGQWTTVGVVFIEIGGDVQVGLNGFTWGTNITNGDRQIAFDVNGNTTGIKITNLNGGSLGAFGNLTDGAKLEIRAYSQQDPGQGRTITAGSLEVQPRPAA